MAYQLAPGLSFCASEGQRIFLDVRRDRYFCLGPDADAEFGRLLGNSLTDPPEAARLDALVARGILCVGESCQPIAPCAAPAAPTRSLFTAARDTGAAAIVGALMRYQISRWNLRWRGLAACLRTFAELKRRVEPSAQADRIAQATARAFKGAALLATTWNFCLPHSLAVATALARRNVAADLVLGVHVGPFMAHAWVQFGDAVVNDQVDTVRDFTPILVL